MPVKPVVNVGLVLAAGQGRRFGAPKQFASLCGQPLYVYSLAEFNRCPAISFVVVVVNRARIRPVEVLVHSRNLRKVAHVVAGGAERTDSVAAGLAFLPEDGVVVVHDAARPMIRAEMISAAIAACRESGPVTFGRPITDTIKRERNGTIVETLDRNGLITVQTPQVFPIPLLRRAYELPRRERVSATDDCALVEKLGEPVRWLEGPVTNIKVTTRADLAHCASLM